MTAAVGRSSDVHPHPVWVVRVYEVGDPVWAVHGTGDADPVAGEWPVLAADDLAGPIPGWSHDDLLAWGQVVAVVRLGSGVSEAKSRTPWDRRLAAISQSFSSSSAPVARRPRALAATRVEPLPVKGSAMMPGGHLSISASMSGCGFGVGWPISATTRDRGSSVGSTDRMGEVTFGHPSPRM